MNQPSHRQQLQEALKRNWKAAYWHLPCSFLEELPSPPPLLQENLIFHPSE